jgi:hypothetical protein
MNAKLVREFDYFEIRLNPSASVTIDPAGKLYFEGFCRYRDFSNAYRLGLWVYSDFDGFVWNVSAGIGGSTIWSDVLPAGDVTARLYCGNLYASPAEWLIVNAEVKVYHGGAQVATTGALGDLTSFPGLVQPSAVPLIGIAPQFNARTDYLLNRRPADGYTSDGDGSLVCGYKFVNGGVDEIDPVLYDVAGPLPGCANAAPPIGAISGTGCYNLTLTAGWHETTTSSTTDWEYWVSSITPAPDLSRKWYRHGDDFQYFAYRFGTPALKKHLRSECQSGNNCVGVTIDPRDAYVTKTPERSAYGDVVPSTTAPMDDAFGDKNWSLCSVSGGKGHYAWTSNICYNGTARFDTIETTGAEVAPTGKNPQLDGHPVTRWWDMLINVHWSHASYWDDTWGIDGADVNHELYYLPARMQYLFAPWLSVGSRRKTRNSITGDNLNAQTYFWKNLVGHNFRNLGARHWYTLDIAPRPSFTYSGTQSALYETVGCTAAYGADIVLTSSGGATALEWAVDLEDIASAVEPQLYVLAADQFKVDHAPTNISAIHWYLGGHDGTEIELTGLPGSWQDKPKGASIEYAGSWGVNNGVSATVDAWTDSLPSGKSVDVMSNIERVHQYQYAPAHSFKELRAKITLVAAGTCTLRFPQMRYNTTTDPSLVWESGQCATMFWKDQGAVRWGNLLWTHPLFGYLLTTPIITALGTRTNVPSALAWEKTVLEGQERSTDMLTDLGLVFDSVEGNTVEDAAFDTFASILPAPDYNRVQFALMNEFDVPPMAFAPTKAVDSDWKFTGAREQACHSWATEPRRYIVPGTKPLELLDDTGVLWTSPEAGYVSGHTVSNHNHQVDNSEAGFTLKWNGTQYAEDCRPFVGHYASMGDNEPVATGGIWNFSNTLGRYHEVWAEDGKIFHGWADKPVPHSGLTGIAQVTAGPDDSEPRGTVTLQNGDVLIVFRRSDSSYRTITRSDGGSYDTPTLMFSNTHNPIVKPNFVGGLLFAAFRWDSGTSGPGKIIGAYQGPSDTGPGSEFNLKDELGADLKFEDLGFCFTEPKDTMFAYVLVAVPEGGSEMKRYGCKDIAGATWKML